MRLKNHLHKLNELFQKDVDLKIDVNKWNRWSASFPVANDTYRVTAYRADWKVMRDALTDKEMKDFTGTNMKEVKKEREEIKKQREAGKRRIPLSFKARKIEEFFSEYPIWVISFTSKKFGDKILDIRTRGEVATIYSGVKKAVEQFMRSVQPPFVIIDAKDPKRAKIYKRFADEIVRRAGYKFVGDKRTIDHGEVKTKGFILFSGRSGSPFN